MTFNEYIKKIRKKNKYDPRKDLKQDTWLWKKTLKTAEKVDKEIYNILHGLRCCGAKLKLDDSNKLILRPVIDSNSFWDNKQDWKEKREKYLLPNAKAIKKVFGKVEKYIDQKRKDINELI